jgi:hypothetical protein
MRRIWIWGAILFWILGGIFFEAAAVEKSLVRVKLMIQADKAVQTVVENELRKEFRSLGDISLVNEKPDFEIRVIVMGSAGKEKEDSGIAFSTVFLSPYGRSGIPDFYLSRCKGDKEGLKIIEEFSEIQFYKDHFLQVGSGKDIEQICRDIAQYFKANISGNPRLPLPSR